MFSVIQVNQIYLIFNPVHFLVDSSGTPYIIKTVAMILLLAVGIGMLVKDVKTNRTISKKE